MSTYRSTMTKEAAHAAIESLRRGKEIERQERLAREEQASRDVCERLLRERQPQELSYAI